MLLQRKMDAVTRAREVPSPSAGGLGKLRALHAHSDARQATAKWEVSKIVYDKT